jgi:branched-subunit amino acid aminotransferase/4-amino-4-deoxychorismate lyase
MTDQQPSVEEFFAGHALYETLLVESGRVAFAREHFARLRSSAEELGFAPPPRDQEIRREIRAHLSSAALRDRSVRLNLRLDREGLSLLTRPVADEIPVARREGVGVITVQLEEDRRGRARHKWVERKNLDDAMAEARRAGAGEALLIAPDGSLLEGATSNVFLRIDGALVTPPTDARILPGVTRSALCSVVRDAGMIVRETSIDAGGLRAASEVFLTSAVRMLVPVISIDGRRIGDGTPGPAARKLSPLLWERAFGEGA